MISSCWFNLFQGKWRVECFAPIVAWCTTHTTHQTSPSDTRHHTSDIRRRLSKSKAPSMWSFFIKEIWRPPIFQKFKVFGCVKICQSSDFWWFSGEGGSKSKESDIKKKKETEWSASHHFCRKHQSVSRCGVVRQNTQFWDTNFKKKSFSIVLQKTAKWLDMTEKYQIWIFLRKMVRSTLPGIFCNFDLISKWPLTTWPLFCS